ncbi:HAD-IIB family hydrolase [Persicirhabdus sediminis]|nr:HAD-IIB family hydrolase [Persicirhabdus sediminis]
MAQILRILSYMHNRFLIFSDLDGTLLHHDTYDWSPAAPMISEIKKQGHILVLNSSKTLAEMIQLADDMQLTYPLVIENGAAIAIPTSFSTSPPAGLRCSDTVGEYRLYPMGTPRKELLPILAEMRSEGYQFEGFADWSDQQIAEATGLPLDRARLAGQRFGTEPLLWRGDEASFQSFKAELESRNLRVLKGGRFSHISGKFDKADGLAALLNHAKQDDSSSNWKTIALGDSQNDQAMLNAADIAVVLPNHSGDTIQVDNDCLYTPSKPSSEGWNDALAQILLT